MIVWVLLALALSPGLVLAQAATIDNVEVVGLEKWTVQMIKDSLALHAPGVAWGSAACAVVLRERLRFADAGVLRFRDGRTVILVVEPERTDRVRLRPLEAIATEVSRAARAMYQVRESNRFGYYAALEAYAAGTEVDRGALDTAGIATTSRVREILDGATGDDALATALELLRSHPDSSMRAIGADLLLPFRDHDVVWHALVGALRDRAVNVQSAAQRALGTLARTRARHVNWAGVTADLRFLLNGTTIVFQPEVMKLLVVTTVSPQLTHLLLPPGDHLVLRELDAEHEYVRDAAHALLVQLRGGDLGKNRNRWATWLEELRVTKGSSLNLDPA